MTKGKKTTALILAGLIVLTVGMTGCKPWTIVKNDQKQGGEGGEVYFGSSDFDVNAYVKDIWDNQLFSYYDDKKQDAATVIADVAKDVNAAGESYGFGSSGQGSSWSFVVSGTGKVLEVNQESRQGLMLVDLAPYDGKADLKLQIGPIIKGTAIRDTIDTIKLSDFANQVLFASISKAFNEKVMTDVLGSLDMTTMKDKEISFLGAFTYTSPDEVLVTPVQVEVGGGN